MMKKLTSQIICVSAFAMAFGMVEAIVVVYLRSLYYPGGFSFPLKMIGQAHVVAELCREFSTIVMLVAVGILAGTTRWQRFAWFMISFGIWDIFYYAWLKVFLDWPSSMNDWDILFLIPIPWIGPVYAPVLISLLMILAGFLILRREAEGTRFSPPVSSWIQGGLGTAVVLFTFLKDTNVTMGGGTPDQFSFWYFFLGILLYLGSLYTAFRNPGPGTDSL